MQHALKSLIEDFCADYEDRFRDPEHAGGFCFFISMQFARDACGYGMQPKLLMWDAVDEAYVDHWAVLVDSETVVDFTRSQIDDAPGVIHRIDSSPPTLYNPRTYPAKMLLSVFDPQKPAEKSAIPAQVLRKIDFERAMFDANRVPAPQVPAWQYSIIIAGLLLVCWQGFSTLWK